MIEDIFLWKIKGIALIEHIPYLLDILKLPYLSKLSGKFLKTSLNNAFYHLVDYLELKKNQIDRKHTSISPLELKLHRIWYFDMNYVPLILLFCYYFPFFIIGKMNCIERSRFQTKGEGQVCVLLNTQNSSFVLLPFFFFTHVTFLWICNEKKKSIEIGQQYLEF